MCRTSSPHLLMLQARKILRATLESESSVERWAAAQCLAHFGVCDSQVVDEIMKQLLASEEPIKHEQGIALLAKISNSTVSMPAVNHQNPCSYNPIHSPTLDYSHFLSPGFFLPFDYCRNKNANMDIYITVVPACVCPFSSPKLSLQLPTMTHGV